jgi:hypothetical protein
MQFKAPNSAYNMTVAAAQEFVAKLKNLGFSVGRIHANGQAAAEQADYIDIAELPIEENEVYNLVALAGGDWHNLAMLKKVYGDGTLPEFERVAADIGISRERAISGLPGFNKAIEALIKKA